VRKTTRLKRLLSLFDLAPDGVCIAAYVTITAVRSYRTISPLPLKRGGIFSAALSVRLPCLGVTQHRFSVESGLSSQIQASLNKSSHTATCKITYKLLLILLKMLLQ